ncbi:MAG: cation:proton antiporter [Ignavibacteriaceae bacterium]|nr:cation:proton antiporter [Ignavibacteriaceae bacterium]
MNQFLVIQDIVVILLVALPIIFLFKKLNIPSIVGFLIAGMIIGPFGFKLITQINEVEVMAEIGVILLLFTIGLEVSFSQLIRIKKFLLIAGGLQVTLTVLFSTVIFYLFGIPLNQAIFFGMLVSLSSTAIVLKLLSDKSELEAPHGKISLGILIFQDLVIVPMFLALPILSTAGDLELSEIAIKLIISFGSVLAIVIIAKLIMPKIMYQLAKLRLRDAFTIGILLILLGTGYLTHTLGLSFALGAFIAGLILAESEYNFQIISDIHPLRDAFNSIFFVSVGMLLNIQFVIDTPFVIIGFSIGLLAFKALIICSIVLLMKYPLRIAIITGLILAQVGEFSFILAQAGSNFNLIGEDYYNVFLGSSIFTMILTPFLFMLAPLVGFKSSEIRFTKEKIEYDNKELTGHVIVAGFGLNGRNLTRVLKETGIKYIVIEMNPDTVRVEKGKGEKIIFGDVSKIDILRKVNIQNANVLVFAISDPDITRRALQLAKKLNPNIYTVVRTRYVNEIEALSKLGADVIIPEEFETSLQIFRKVLEQYHIPLNIIMKQVSLIRNESYILLRKDVKEPSSFIHLDEIFAEGLTETYYVNEDNPHVGKLLSEIHLRAETDATIIAIVRNGKTITNPSGREIILAHDTLVITGIHASVDKAIWLLNGEKDE